MGKKKRAGIKTKPARLIADEVTRYGHVQVERYGRFLKFTNSASDDEMKVYRERLAVANKAIVEKLEEAVRTFQESLARFNPLDVMTHAAFELLPLFIQQKTEQEYSPDESIYLPTLEYIQYLIARTTPLANEFLDETAWDSLWKDARSMMDIARQYLMTRRRSSNSIDLDELRFTLDMRRMMVRIENYPFFQSMAYKAALLPYDIFLKKQFGLSAVEMMDGLNQIFAHQQTNISKSIKSILTARSFILKRILEQSPDAISWNEVQLSEAVRAVTANPDYADLVDGLVKATEYASSHELFDITGCSELKQPLLDLLSTSPGESPLYSLSGPNHDDLSPLTTSVLKMKPFFRKDLKYYYFLHSGLEDFASKIIESELFSHASSEEISRMSAERSRYDENEVADLFREMLRPDCFHANVFYPNPDDSDSPTELDILLAVDDCVFLVEVKSGGFSEQARRGAPQSIAQELADLISEGQRQSERAKRYITSRERATFRDVNGKLIREFDRANCRMIFRVVCTREFLGWVGAQLAIMSVFDKSLDNSMPWHVSVSDLRIVSHLFAERPIRFIHYLSQRLKASGANELRQKDEVDHIGLHFSMNEYHHIPVQGMKRIMYHSSYALDIEKYFMKISAKGEALKPEQKMHQAVKDLVSALEKCRLPGRVAAGLGILGSDDSSRENLAKMLDEMHQKRLVGRRPSIRMLFEKGLGGLSITYASDSEEYDLEAKFSAAHMLNAREQQWVVVQVEMKQNIEVTDILRLDPNSYSPTELQRVKNIMEIKTRESIRSSDLGRNDPCPCGSGLKFKRCHGAADRTN